MSIAAAAELSILDLRGRSLGVVEGSGKSLGQDAHPTPGRPSCNPGYPHTQGPVGRAEDAEGSGTSLTAKGAAGLVVVLLVSGRLPRLVGQVPRVVTQTLGGRAEIAIDGLLLLLVEFAGQLVQSVEEGG